MYVAGVQVLPEPPSNSCRLLGWLLCGGAPQQQASSCARSSSCSPFLRSPPLSSNATALKWAGPVPDATRTAVAGLLAQLVLLPHMAQAASDRLATPRLVTLLTQCMQHLTETSGAFVEEAVRSRSDGLGYAALGVGECDHRSPD